MAESVGEQPPVGGDPNAGERTALQKHVDFFDREGKGAITWMDTYTGMLRLGVGAARAAAFANVTNGMLGPKTTGRPTLSIDTSRIHVGKHSGDSDIYDEDGAFVEARFEEVFAENDRDGDGELSAAEVTRMVLSNFEDPAGLISSFAEFGLLLELCGERRLDARLWTISKERMRQMYDGSLLYTVADEVAERRAEEESTPLGMMVSAVRRLWW